MDSAPGVPEEFRLGSRSQRHALIATFPLIKKAIEGIKALDVGIITLTDYGSVDGVNSYDTFYKLLGQLRAEMPRKSITMTFNGDDNSLFSEVTSQWKDFQEVYYFMTGGSFFEQLYPSNSVVLGVSGTAFHRVSSIPSPVTGHISPSSASAAQKTAWMDQTAKDWKVILEMRTRELMVGGFLVFTVPAQNSSGNSPFKTLFDDLNTLLQKQVSDKKITQEEYNQILIPSYPRTRDQFLAPFQEKKFTCAGGVLSLEVEELKPLSNPYYHDALTGDHVDRQKFSRNYTLSVHSWLGSFLFQQLNTSRSPPEREKIVSDIFHSLEGAIARNAEKYETDFVVMNMLLKKIR